jgi:hypothetical protein
MAGCTNLCLQMQTCPSGTTTVTGTVYAPNGVDPVSNVIVYVPNASVSPLPTGVKCTCPLMGSPLVSAVTGADGSFVLNNVPVGSNIPLVAQIGAWRRQVMVPSVAACTATAAPTIRLPRTSSEGEIPHIALVTGGSDGIECMLRNLGLDDSEFTTPSGTGRVHLYDSAVAKGAFVGGVMPSESLLWAAQATLNQYDAVILACPGAAAAPTAGQVSTLRNFVNAGGRALVSHDSYPWLSNTAPFSGAAVWHPEQTDILTDPQTALINQTTQKGATLAQQLLRMGASTVLGQVSVSTLRHDVDDVVAPTHSWFSVSAGATSVPGYFSSRRRSGRPACSSVGASPSATPT